MVKQKILSFFAYKNDYSNIKTEIIAGCTTFLTMMYIIVVNPMILKPTGMDYHSLITATILVSAISSILMGLFAKNPIAIAPGMGMNAYFSYTVVLGQHIPWQVALGAVFWAGILFVIIAATNIREHIIKAIPVQLRFAIASGIGLFISFVGLRNAGFITANTATLTGINHINLVVFTFLVGLLVTAYFVSRKTRGALIIGILVTTLLAIPLGRLWGFDTLEKMHMHTLVNWQGVFSLPSFNSFLHMDLWGGLKLAVLPVLFTFLFTSIFDGLATLMGVAEAGKLMDKQGNPRHLKRSLIISALSNLWAAIFGSSSGTAFVESATGIEEGGKTGLTAVVVGLLFLPFLFLSPLISAIPNIATAPALIIVGVFMMRPIIKIDWLKMDNAIPCFLTISLIPLANSITQGIIWGLLSWSLLKILLRKWQDITPTLLIIDAFAICLIIIKIYT